MHGTVRDVGLTPGLGRCPGGGKWLCIPVVLPGTSHRQRSLAGHSPHGRKELDTTEQLSGGRARLHPQLEGARQGWSSALPAGPEARGALRWGWLGLESRTAVNMGAGAETVVSPAPHPVPTLHRGVYRENWRKVSHRVPSVAPWSPEQGLPGEK